jgi:hypothetical protein
MSILSHEDFQSFVKKHGETPMGKRYLDLWGKFGLFNEACNTELGKAILTDVYYGYEEAFKKVMKSRSKATLEDWADLDAHTSLLDRIYQKIVKCESALKRMKTLANSNKKGDPSWKRPVQ